MFTCWNAGQNDEQRKDLHYCYFCTPIFNDISCWLHEIWVWTDCDLSKRRESIWKLNFFTLTKNICTPIILQRLFFSDVLIAISHYWSKTPLILNHFGIVLQFISIYKVPKNAMFQSLFFSVNFLLWNKVCYRVAHKNENASQKSTSH